MSRAPRILYIDDEKDLVDLAVTFFADENLAIESCTCFKEALKLIQQNEYDLIISDAKMPSGYGGDFLNQIRDQGLFKGKFILVTGNIDSSYEKNKNSFDEVLYKPLQFQTLIDKVKLMLMSA